MMFKPIRSVEHSCFCDRNVDNQPLAWEVVYRSARNGAESVAFSMAMIITAFCAYIYSQSLEYTRLVSSILNLEGCERITGWWIIE